MRHRIGWQYHGHTASALIAAEHQLCTGIADVVDTDLLKFGLFRRHDSQQVRMFATVHTPTG
jgi:hypothetical protein